MVKVKKHPSLITISACNRDAPSFMMLSFIEGQQNLSYKPNCSHTSKSRHHLGVEVHVISHESYRRSL